MLQRVEKSSSKSKFLPSPRYFVPDLSTVDRSVLKKMKPRAIFVAESPHVNEIEPETPGERRPLCGMAGRKWWGLVSELLEGEANADVSLARLLETCFKHRIVIMNAVQYPLDPKVAVVFPEADPAKNLGFNKVSGLYSFKKLKAGPQVRAAIDQLTQRLRHPSLKDAPIYCLGNDAEWFVTQALSPAEFSARVGQKIPHPSAWWRKGGHFGRVARERLTEIFGKNRSTV
jgi:hypothetical protein